VPVKCETNLLNLINSSLANIYCRVTLSNHGAIRLKRFISQFTRELCNWFFLFCPHFVLHAFTQIFDVMFFTKFFWKLNEPEWSWLVAPVKSLHPLVVLLHIWKIKKETQCSQNTTACLTVQLFKNVWRKINGSRRTIRRLGRHRHRYAPGAY